MDSPISNIKQNTLATKPRLSDALNALKKDILIGLNCHAIATIQSFDSVKQTAVATVTYKKTYFQYSEKTNDYAPYLVDYPILLDCPVIVLRGGPISLTFPIDEGDECVVLFNDRDLDNWFHSGDAQTGACATSRLHSLSDGMIIVGINSLPNLIQNYSTTHGGLINNAGAQISLNKMAAKALIGNDSTTLNTLLQSLITDIKTLIVAIQAITVGGTSIDNPAAFTPITASLTTLSTQIGGLLE